MRTLDPAPRSSADTHAFRWLEIGVRGCLGCPSVEARGTLLFSAEARRIERASYSWASLAWRSECLDLHEPRPEGIAVT